MELDRKTPNFVINVLNKIEHVLQQQQKENDKFKALLGHLRECVWIVLKYHFKLHNKEYRKGDAIK